MYDPTPSTIGLRDVIAAWVVCLAIAAAVLLVPPALSATGPSAVEARTAAHTQICVRGDLPPLPPHG